jgi:hypothetical protein
MSFGDKSSAQNTGEFLQDYPPSSLARQNLTRTFNCTHVSQKGPELGRMGAEDVVVDRLLKSQSIQRSAVPRQKVVHLRNE